MADKKFFVILCYPWYSYPSGCVVASDLCSETKGSWLESSHQLYAAMNSLQ